MASGRGGSERVLAKLKRSVESGDYYEAHQMYRTLYFRYLNQQKYAEATDLLYNGASTLLQHNQHGSGVDLALLLVDVLEKASTIVNDDIIEKLSYLHSMIKYDHIERPNFASKALKWSGHNAPQHRTGHPYLHQKFAMTFWKEKTYSSARHHFLHSQDGEGCATMLVEYHITAGYPSEVDLFIAQAVLQYLCLSNRATAESCLSNYTKQHPQVEEGPPYVRPLLNFLWLLLLACEGGKVAVFTILVEQYQPSLKRDPTYTEYLDRIGQLFFGLPPPKNQSRHGLLDNLMSSLLGMGGDDEYDDDPQGAGATFAYVPEDLD